MPQAVVRSEPGVLHAKRAVHGLQEEMLELQVHVALRLGARLGIYELQLVSAALDQRGSRLGADAPLVSIAMRNSRS
jgi:hypothetical protein